MTRFEVELRERQPEDAKQFLSSLINDGLVDVHGDRLTLTEQGRPFSATRACFSIIVCDGTAPGTHFFAGTVTNGQISTTEDTEKHNKHSRLEAGDRRPLFRRKVSRAGARSKLS